METLCPAPGTACISTSTADKAGRAGQGTDSGTPACWNGHVVAGMHTGTHANGKCDSRRGCLEMLLPTAHGWSHPGIPRT